MSVVCAKHIFIIIFFRIDFVEIPAVVKNRKTHLCLAVCHLFRNHFSCFNT